MHALTERGRSVPGRYLARFAVGADRVIRDCDQSRLDTTADVANHLADHLVDGTTTASGDTLGCDPHHVCLKNPPRSRYPL